MDEPTSSIPIDPDPDRPPEPVISLMLTSNEGEIKQTVTLNIEGQDYLLTIDDSMNEYCRQ